MISSDERFMWYADTEKLAEKLANKTVDQIQDIFDESDLFVLRSGNKKTVSVFGRLLMPFAIFLFLTIGGVKWIITGDRFVDSTVKKYPFLNKVIVFCGLR